MRDNRQQTGFFGCLLPGCCLAVAWLLPSPPAAAADPDPKLSGQALAVLAKKCGTCHGPNGRREDGIDYFDDAGKLVANKKVFPGNAAKSRIVLRASPGGGMPDEGDPLTPAELDLLKNWINALAPAAAASAPPPAEVQAPEKRGFVSLTDNLEAMRRFLERTPARDQRFQRFFTFTNLHNNPKVTAGELRLYQAALSKMLNSLSWRASVVVPQPVDKEQTVWAVDIRKLDWDRHDLWLEVLRAYPYALTHDDYPDNEALKATAKRVYELAGSKLPFVRADWFIATASRPGPGDQPDTPGLYHTLLQLPTRGAELERMLGVDCCDNFRTGKLARAGFSESNVSRQNRLIERHESKFGAYWKSYDFKSNVGRENLHGYPLGPVFDSNPYNPQAFAHVGGEIVFTLPNGLNGYMLVDGHDRRINAGPTEIVRDKTEISGSVAIVNGLSCINCHQRGVKGGKDDDKRIKDTIRSGTAVGGTALDKVRELYPKEDEMNRLLQADEDRFLQALDRVTGLFLKVGPDQGKDVRDFPEVIGPVAKRHLLDVVTLEDAARELGLKDPAELRTAIRLNGKLQQMGLKPLAEGNAVKREVWEAKAGRLVPSAYQEAATVLELGTPGSR
jgi:serine/threonine-protein kinase